MRGQNAKSNPVQVGPTASVVILDNNVDRAGAVVHNEAGTMFIKYGLGASQSSYSRRLTANMECLIDNYTGVLSAIKLSGTSNAMVTEVW